VPFKEKSGRRKRKKGTPARIFCPREGRKGKEGEGPTPKQRTKEWKRSQKKEGSSREGEKRKGGKSLRFADP